MIRDIQGWKQKLSFKDKKKIDNIFKLVEKNQVIDLPFLAEKVEKNFFEEIKELSKKFKQKKKIFLVGTGGSSLGAKALLEVDYKSRITFIENIDPHYIREKILNSPKSKIGFIIVSKSGETIEVLSILLILEEYFSKHLQLSKNCIIITENKNSTLFKFAQDRKIPVISHSKKISGRFSCFSVTGLLPAEISGLDSKKIYKLANKSFKYYFSKEKALNKKNILHLKKFIDNRKISGHVFLSYIEGFKSISEWYRQLWAESIGKNGKGIYLLPAIGSIDQHSQLQIWLEGRRDLVFTILVPKRRRNKINVNDKSKILPDYLNQKPVGDILNKMCDATIMELKKLNIPVRIIYLEDDSLKSAISLMTTLMIEVAILCKTLNMNPYDQPAVEKVKTAIKKLLT